MVLPRLPRLPKAPKANLTVPSVPNPSRRLAEPSSVAIPEPDVPLPVSAEDERRAEYEAFRQHTNASYIEFICFQWLVQKRRQVPNVDFIFQNPIFGGKTVFGGFVLDFYFPARRLVWFVQGLYWHRRTPTDRARNALSKALVSGRGLTVVEVFEDDVLQREEFTLSSAFDGRQISRPSE